MVNDEARPAWLRAAQSAAVAIVFASLAVALGIWADVGQRLPGYRGRLPELGTPWFLIAYAAGRALARRCRWAAPAASVAVIFLGLTSYVMFLHLRDGVSYYNICAGRVRYWSTLGILTGAFAGLLALLSFSRLAMGAWAAAVAVPLAEIKLVEGWSIDGRSQAALAACLAVVSLHVTVWALMAIRRIPLTFGPLAGLAWCLGWVAMGSLSSVRML